MARKVVQVWLILALVMTLRQHVMTPIQLFDPESSTYTYILFDEISRDAVIIDPVDVQIERDLATLRQYGLRLVWTIETHVHADHITSAGQLAELAGVNGQIASAATVMGLMCPESPSVERWETLWHYMQGGPGVFRGDLFFYQIDGDYRQRVREIDTSRTPLYLLTGEFDYSCSPADTKETAAHIKGATVKIMPRLGHFPMSENPEAFIAQLRPVLDEIASVVER